MSDEGKRIFKEMREYLLTDEGVNSGTCELVLWADRRAREEIWNQIVSNGKQILACTSTDGTSTGFFPMDLLRKIIFGEGEK